MVGHLGGADHFVLVLEEDSEVAVRRAHNRMRVYGPARPPSKVLPRGGVVVAGAKGPPDDPPREPPSRVFPPPSRVPPHAPPLTHPAGGKERVPPDPVRRG